ncbi:helicase-related protein [Opitutus terrae]|uniref:Helicase domain protein n=1 Tax=Opitutus terrae (strain DSM 11246 / JCM 15787 / PB90-1) TaxID=452637 RepID=B1ZPF3_OPITP|nr:helicase-related protein [Opitutus terrae]ACB74472.1 helicase domain protein [Opitutus terrae PB90-1]
MPIRYADEKRLLDYLVQRLEDRLAGRHETEILRTQPSDHCQLGVLAPWTAEADLEEQPEEVVVPEARADLPDVARPAPRAARPARGAPAPAAVEGEAEPEPPVEPFALREDAARRPPSALGLAVAVASDAGEVVLRVAARCTVYSRHFPDYASQRLELGNRPTDVATPGERASVSLVEKLHRHVLDLPAVTFRLAAGVATTAVDDGQVQGVFTQLVSQLRDDPSTLRKFEGNRVVPVGALQNEAAFQRFLQAWRGPAEVPNLRVSVRVRAQPIAGGLRIEVHLCNNSRRDLDRPSNDQFSSLYDTEVGVTVVSGSLIPIELLPVPDDYQYDRNVYALGRNAGTEVSADRRSIRTRALARYEQPRTRTQERVVARYRDLADNPFPVLEAIHGAMHDYARDWTDRIIGNNALGLPPDALAACDNDLAAFRAEIGDFSAGIAALHADERLLTAFQAMNRAFADSGYPAWRLFQIVFIVSQLPSLLVREGRTSAEWPAGTVHDWSDILDRADVLWFPTGGGKTEAYLGLVGCAALYDRLRGKHFGVTAWLRFPLRMLSVQQLQRAMRTVWLIELQRRDLERTRGRLGDRFSLGYFVGSSNTPNRLGSWIFDRLESDERQRERLLLIPDCPACRREGEVAIQVDRTNERIRHVCGHCHVELPVYISDDEIYRFQPTLLVGTIDKVAAIAYRAEVATLWLGPQWRCANPEHGFGNGEWCTVFGCNSNNTRATPRAHRVPVVPHDPAPALHIQDELHLLQEELGAFAGHYETMVRANERASTGQPAKIIAATATIAGYVHQARQIYGVRAVRRFPNRGYSLDQNFYATVERESSAADAPAKTARIFTAFRPPFLRPADAVARCAEILHEAINELQSDPVAHGRRLVLEATSEAEIRELLAFYSRTLTYVGKRDSGVRITQRFEQDSAKAGSGLRPGGVRDLNVKYLSGHSTLKEISTTVKRAESQTPWAAADHLDATVATDVISHGVDVEYYNLMFLERIPEQVANYIQVSSRSGRQHVGLVLAILPRYSLRASSIYDRFPQFHRHLDRMVLPVPVNRFARAAVNRSFPGVLLGSLYGRYLNALHGSKPERLRWVSRGMSAGAAPLSRDALREALFASYALGDSRYDLSLEAQMTEALERDWQRFLLEILTPNHQDLTELFEPKPMSSLRDVDVPVPFRPDDAAMDYRELRWFGQR